MTLDGAIKELKASIKGAKYRNMYYAELVHIEALEIAIKALEQEHCEDYVSRKAGINIIDSWLSCDGYNEAERHIMRAMQSELHDLPSVTPQPKTGHWIAQAIHNCHTEFKCSECGYIHSSMHLYGKPTADYTYCPNCGAKMVWPQESEDKE